MTEELKRRNLALPDDVWRQIKSRAAMEGVTIPEYLTKLIRFTPVAPTTTPWSEVKRIKEMPGSTPQNPSTLDVAKVLPVRTSTTVDVERFGVSRPAPKKK